MGRAQRRRLPLTGGDGRGSTAAVGLVGGGFYGGPHDRQRHPLGALVEDHLSTVRLTGAPLGEPWESAGWDGPDWPFTSAAHDSPADLYALWDVAVERSRARIGAALADGGPARLVHLSWPDGRHASLRRLLCDLIEEYGRHTGHADLLREAVDGRVGEDPPAGWKPVTAGVTGSGAAPVR
ncbi:DUF664 domain-containing protein [Nonomuraea sp. NPDC049377]|uniref:mycothiol transferase n=1 Tax=Nonomuraea sp. NPDC049377 TaxID=3364351 RepID=UPI0037AAD1E8